MSQEVQSESFLTLEIADAYGLSLQMARRLRPEEKKQYRPESADYILISLGGIQNLTELRGYVARAILSDRTPDGRFLGCSNSVWIITPEEWDALLAANQALIDAKAAAARAEADSEKASREEKIAEARRTGVPVLLRTYVTGCNGKARECSQDIVSEYLDGEGAVTVKRSHTH